MREIIIVLVLFVIASSASAVTVYEEWTGAGGDGSWNTAGNWANTNGSYGSIVPSATDHWGIAGSQNYKAGFKRASSGVSPTFSSGIISSDQFVCGGTASANPSVTIDGATLNVSQYASLGAGATDCGTLTMNSGTINTGYQANTGIFYVTQLGTGKLNMNGGTINVGYADPTWTPGRPANYNSALTMTGTSTTASGTLNLAGGTIYANDLLKGSGIASVVITNGTLVLRTNRGTGVGNAITGELGGYIAAGWLTAGAGYTLQSSYNAGTDLTTVTAFTASPEAKNPNPANSATNVAINATLSWTAGTGATSHNVYFGTTLADVNNATDPNALPGRGNQSGTTWNPGTLLAGTIYYWRVDEVSGSGITVGTVWSFTTAPAKATTPSPSSGATGVALNATLSWAAGAGATSHDVYFGTISPGTSRGNQTGTSFNPGALTANTIYYWRIDEKDGSGVITTGDVWSFTTGNLVAVNPYLSWRNDPTNSIVVNWWNPFAIGDSNVQYGLTTSYGSTVKVATLSNYHHVELTGLTPSTTYHYKISSSDGTIGNDKTFTTADAMADANTYSFSFAMYGDPRGTYPANEPYYTRHRALCDWIAAQGYKFALETGDIVWAGNATTQEPLSAQTWYQDFFDIEKNLAGSKVIMATMGNHEVQVPVTGQTSTFTYYYDLYTGAFPTNGPAVDGKGRVYSFNYGNAHFVSLSSFQIDVTQQKNWLIADLTAARANPNIKWVFVMMHAPLYTTNGHQVAQSMIDAWAPVFEQYGVDIVFGGHNHCYERSYPIRSGQVAADGRAPIYVTNGMGGAEFNSTLPNPLFAASYGSQSPGAQTVVTGIMISGLHMTVTTITNATGVPVDSFTLTKTPPPIVGDFNTDYEVDFKDVGIFAGSWLDSGLWP